MEVIIKNLNLKTVLKKFFRRCFKLQDNYLKFNVKVTLEDLKDQKLPDVMVYAFDSNGQYLSSKPLPKGRQEEISLNLPSKLQGTTVRFFIGPSVMKESQEIPSWLTGLLKKENDWKEIPSPVDLKRKGAYEKRVLLNPNLKIVELVILPDDWIKWLLCRCVVRGRLLKRVPLPDGSIQEMGVCHACVKIYEVDKFYHLIMHLPDRDLFRLRDELRVLLDKQLRVPGPPPSPIIKNESLKAIPLRHETKAICADSLNVSSKIQDELEPVFLAVSAIELRKVLVNKANLLAQFACIWEWLHFYYHLDLIRCTCTDEQGRFETTILYPCFKDKPDLYFKALQCIGGTLHTIYAPSVACHTHWNYECGTELVLEVTDPAARVCTPPLDVEPPPGIPLWIMPYAVGGIRLEQIKLSGLTDFNDGNGTWEDVPFGGKLGFRHGYSSVIPMEGTNKPYYYRWMYSLLDSAGNETQWREFAEPVAQTVVRHYVDEDLAHPEKPPTFPAYTLGPHSINNMHLYEFKPHQPPQISGHNRYWPTDSWFGEIYTGILKSTNLPGGVINAAGTYKIRLEVYDQDGIHVVPGEDTFQFIVPTGLASDGVTILSRTANTDEVEKITKNGQDYYGFVFKLHIDNNSCEAEIYDASVNGIGAGPCGFIAFPAGADVNLSFKAYHPNGFARFKFTVVKGSSGYVGSASAPSNPTSVNWANAPLVTESAYDFTNSPMGNFSKDVSVSNMLDDCPQAAFGENLRVVAAATDGWVRLSEFDAYALPKAFALDPETT